MCYYRQDSYGKADYLTFCLHIKNAVKYELNAVRQDVCLDMEGGEGGAL